jgi:hypothetical protein
LPSFRAYPAGSSLAEDQLLAYDRLIGRSVWNTRWLLIIPGKTLLADADQGLDTFIDEVSDIKLHIRTYAVSGP